LLSLYILIFGIAKSIKADLLFSSKDTRIESKEWFEKNIPALSKVALDSIFSRPQINQSITQLKEKQQILGRQPELKELKSKKLELQLKAAGDNKTYNLYFLIVGDEDSGQFLNFWPVIYSNIQELKKSGIEYLVFNNMTTSRQMQLFHQKVAKVYTPIAVFSPYCSQEFRPPLDKFETTCIPIGTKELFSRRASGPYLIIYKAK
jgi:hypothetical protein